MGVYVSGSLSKLKDKGEVVVNQLVTKQLTKFVFRRLAEQCLVKYVIPSELDGALNTQFDQADIKIKELVAEQLTNEQLTSHVWRYLADQTLVTHINRNSL